MEDNWHCQLAVQAKQKKEKNKLNMLAFFFPYPAAAADILILFGYCRTSVEGSPAWGHKYQTGLIFMISNQGGSKSIGSNKKKNCTDTTHLRSIWTILVCLLAADWAMPPIIRRGKSGPKSGLNLPSVLPAELVPVPWVFYQPGLETSPQLAFQSARVRFNYHN